MKKHNGFTLIELMIVVAIIGILSGIAVPYYNSYVKETGRVYAKTGLALLADKQERFYLQNNTYTDSFALDGLNTSNVSEQGYYNFSIASTDLLSGFVLTATADAGKPQAKDTDCKVMTLSSTGVKTPNACW